MLESPHHFDVYGLLSGGVMPQNSGKQSKSEFFSRAWQIGILTTVPFVLVAGPVLGYLAGNWLDQKYHSDPYAKLVLIILGLGASVREIIQIVRSVLKT